MGGPRQEDPGLMKSVASERTLLAWVAGCGVAAAASLWALARADRPGWFLVVAGVAVLGATAVVLLERRARRTASASVNPTHESEEKFRRIFDTMADGYYRSRLSDGSFLDVNPAAAEILGYPSIEALMERRTTDLYANLEDRAPIIEEIKRHGEFRGLEVALRRYDGSVATVLISGRILYDEAGQPVEQESNFIDVSTRKEAEAALEEARLHAEQANRAKSAFLANMSHELRTPMNAIIGYSEILMEDAEEEGNSSAVEDLRKIHGASTHLLGLINDVLDLSKVEAGKMELYPETFDVSAMIDGVTETVATLLQKNDNRLDVTVDPSLTQMRADLTKVRQATLNLLSNAAKFTHQGAIGLTVRPDLVDGQEQICIAISDSGIGIPPEKIDQIFDEFSQADDTTTRDYGGTGLGLPISRRFCRMMGGDISVESQLGKGSVFTIRLPLGLEPAAAQPAETARELASAAEANHLVLVIDDDPNALDLLGRTLQGAGMRVVTTSDGREALRLARTLRPSVITLDVQMPDMDGWAVLRELKADPETRAIPVVMVTMTDDRKQGYALGATDFLTKPVDRARLVELLERCAPREVARRALVVDDQATSRDVLRRALESADWEVTEAENGSEALERIAESQPSLILLDLMMPIMDGFEFVIALRREEAWRQIPVVVVTAKDLTEEDRRRLNGNVAGLVQKVGLEQDAMLSQVLEQVAAAAETPSKP